MAGLAVSGAVAGAAPTHRTGTADSGSSAPGSSKSGSSASSTATALESRFITVIDTVRPSVVMVRTNSGLGSGVVFDAKGDIVTNNHVVTGATSLSVVTANGHQTTASIVGTFPEDDLAVVHAKGLSGLHPATFANSSNVRVGDIVLAMGNPLGLASSVTQGIVSALGRTVAEPNGTPIPGTIQTSAPINPGNSGGALIDLAGKVVGIPTLTATDPQIGGAAVGIGFAIPSNTVKTIAGQLVKYGKVKNSHRAYLGITAADIPTGTGVLVVSVETGGPATKAGIHAGELIRAVGGHKTTSAEALAVVLASMTPGRTVSVKVMKPTGATATAKVTLGQYPS